MRKKEHISKPAFAVTVNGYLIIMDWLPVTHIEICPLYEPSLLQTMKDNSIVSLCSEIYTYMLKKELKELLNIQQIQEIIPHRFPFLLIDRIIELEAGVRAVGLKNVTMNEPFFEGHFPGFPVMPGVLIVEALAQVGSVVMLSLEVNRGKLGFFAGIDEFRFRGQVVPGDTLILEVIITRLKGAIGKGTAVAKVGDRVVAEGGLMFALSERQ
jgi:3-hydroxyacyl-[acyl-carrier-protein] dehydratase